MRQFIQSKNKSLDCKIKKVKLHDVSWDFSNIFIKNFFFFTEILRECANQIFYPVLNNFHIFCSKSFIQKNLYS